MGNIGSKDDLDSDGDSDGDAAGEANLAVHTLAAGTLLFTSKNGRGKKPYIISESTSAFVQFCLLAEASMNAHEKILKAYTPPRAVRRPPAQRRREPRTTHNYSDPERGDTYSNVVVDDDTHAVVIVKERTADDEYGYADTDAAGMRNRAGSPQRSEEWFFDARALAQPQPQPQPQPHVRLSDYRIEQPFGDVAHSQVAELLPTVPGYPVLDGSVNYCRINRVEMWAAYSVFEVFRKEDAGLITAVCRGDVDFALHPNETNRTASAKKRIEAWRGGYAETLHAYNSVVSAFSDEAGAYFATEVARGSADPRVHALNMMARAVSAANTALLTKPMGDARDYQ
jgi:hypothetical protein